MFKEVLGLLGVFMVSVTIAAVGAGLNSIAQLPLVLGGVVGSIASGLGIAKTTGIF